MQDGQKEIFQHGLNMPTYKFHDYENNQSFEDFLSIDEKDKLLKLNPHIEQVPNGFAIVSTVGNLDSKTDGGFREVMSKIAEQNPHTPVAERYGSRSIRDVKVEQAIKKWKNR